MKAPVPVIGVLVAVGAVAGVVAYSALKRLRSKRHEPAPAVVTQLFVFPVKSCSAVPHTSLTLTKRGVEYDREWCVFRKDNMKFCSQRDFPLLKLLVASVVEEESSLQHVHFLRIAQIEDAVTCKEVPNKAPLLVPVKSADALSAAAAISVDIWGLVGTVVDEGPEAAAWLSKYLGAEVFLGRSLDPRHAREASGHGPFIPAATEEILLQDFSPLHVCTEEGIQHLQVALKDPSINVLRFRPNVVVRGVPFPDEDRWEYFRIGDLLAKTVKLTSRCSMPTVNDKGQRNPDFLPTAYLKKERSVAERGKSAKPMFGLSVFHAIDPATFTTHTIRLGDAVTVVSLTAPRLYESSE